MGVLQTARRAWKGFFRTTHTHRPYPIFQWAPPPAQSVARVLSINTFSTEWLFLKVKPMKPMMLFLFPIIGGGVYMGWWHKWCGHWGTVITELRESVIRISWKNLCQMARKHSSLWWGKAFAAVFAVGIFCTLWSVTQESLVNWNFDAILSFSDNLLQDASGGGTLEWQEGVSGSSMDLQKAP